MAEARIRISVLDVPAFKEFVERVHEFIGEYAWHTRMCSAVDADGEWRLGNRACDCGYEEALAALAHLVEVDRG